MDILNDLNNFRMVTATSVANLGALHRFPILDVPGSTFVPDPVLMAFLNKILKLVTNTTQSLVLIISMAIKKCMSLRGA
jgi:hypothetical protein